MKLRRVALHLLLTVVLLFAQHAALSHALQHAGNLPAQTQQYDGGKQNSQSSPCDFHVSFAQLAGAVESCSVVFHIPQGDLHAGDRTLSTRHPARLLVPASRGPPAFP